MARLTNWRDVSQSLEAARTWIDTCLIQDGSLFTRESLWTPALIEEVKRGFVDHPDTSKRDFITKLKDQLSAVTPRAKQLAAEMLWVLFLFPAKTKFKPRTKRAQIEEIWELSGQPFPDVGLLLSDGVLGGIGSAGQAYNNLRYKELAYLISLVQGLKTRDSAERSRILGDYDRFIQWIGSVHRDGSRQFRHMFRYFLFPDRVERISSNNDRRKILKAFEVAPADEIDNWSDQRYDEELQRLRTKLERQNPGKTVDFYDPEFSELWQKDEEEEGEEEEEDGHYAKRIIASLRAR